MVFLSVHSIVINNGLVRYYFEQQILLKCERPEKWICIIKNKYKLL